VVAVPVPGLDLSSVAPSEAGMRSGCGGGGGGGSVPEAGTGPASRQRARRTPAQTARTLSHAIRVLAAARRLGVEGGELLPNTARR